MVSLRHCHDKSGEWKAATESNLLISGFMAKLLPISRNSASALAWDVLLHLSCCDRCYRLTAVPINFEACIWNRTKHDATFNRCTSIWTRVGQRSLDIFNELSNCNLNLRPRGRRVRGRERKNHVNWCCGFVLLSGSGIECAKTSP